LRQSDALLKEIIPRLNSLERQVKRLEQRDTLESELKGLETQYYGGMWHHLRKAYEAAKSSHERASILASESSKQADELEAELHAMEKAIPPSEEFGKLRQTLNQLMDERSKMRERQLRLESSREVAAARAEKPWSPLPLSKIIQTIETLHLSQNDLLAAIEAPNPDIGLIKKLASQIREQTADLISKLQRPAPEPEAQAHKDPKLEKEIADLVVAYTNISRQIQAVQEELEGWNKREESKRAHIFEVQRKLSSKRAEVQAAERHISDAAVELARVETRRDSFLQDVRTHAPDKESELDNLAAEWSGQGDPEALLPRIAKLRAQLEWIGGIDPETLKEYEQTKTRYDELLTQTQDLLQAVASLETIIKELDQTIAERSKSSFLRLNREFSLYFKKLFGGGDAYLQEVFAEPEVNEQGEVAKPVDPAAGPTGIEILATPPGKRLKAIALLSGGERALISIALICAIMATNPSPFVVLDEVDAALDESNSRKFAEIISSLADRTQFVVITHNRATMERSHILYGVTMSDQGISQLLSVKLKDIVKS